MKRKLKFLVFLSFLISIILVISFFIRPLLLSVIKDTIKKNLNVNFVDIRDFDFYFPNLLRFKEVKINKEGFYEFKTSLLEIHFNLSSIRQKRILAVKLNDAFLKINALPEEFVFNKASTKEFFKIEKIEISRLFLDCKTKDFEAKAKIFLSLDLDNFSIDYLDVFVDNIKISNKLYGSDLLFYIVKDSNIGKFLAKEIKFDKIKIENIIGKFTIKDTLLDLKDFLADFSGGIVKLKGYLNFANKEFDFAMHFSNIDSKRLAKILNFEDKFKISGLWQGMFTIAGKEFNIKKLDGNFSVMSGGGSLTVTDTKFLEDLAVKQRLPKEILVERFKDYEYNRANMDISLLGEDLIFRIFFEGVKGKSNFQIVFHNFLATVTNLSKLTGGAK